MGSWRRPGSLQTAQHTTGQQQGFKLLSAGKAGTHPGDVYPCRHKAVRLGRADTGAMCCVLGAQTQCVQCAVYSVQCAVCSVLCAVKHGTADSAVAEPKTHLYELVAAGVAGPGAVVGGELVAGCGVEGKARVHVGQHPEDFFGALIAHVDLTDASRIGWGSWAGTSLAIEGCLAKGLTHDAPEVGSEGLACRPCRVEVPVVYGVQVLVGDTAVVRWGQGGALDGDDGGALRGPRGAGRGVDNLRQQQQQRWEGIEFSDGQDRSSRHPATARLWPVAVLTSRSRLAEKPAPHDHGRLALTHRGARSSSTTAACRMVEISLRRGGRGGSSSADKEHT